MAEIKKRPLKVFLCHASGDKQKAMDLYQRLVSDGVDAWLDKEKLLPGQDWNYEIQKAARESDVFVIVLSEKSATKEGYIQKEIKLALDILDEKPEGTLFLIPARLENCDVPLRLSRWHWVDLFSNDGYGHLLRALKARASQIGAKSIGSAKPKKSPEKEFIARRYRVGKIQTEVYMDLMGGGNQYFNRANLTFDYEHTWMPLPEPIEKERKSLISKMEKAAKDKGHIFFNGPAIRLHSFDLNVAQSENGKEEKNPVLHLRPTCWHDFALSNRRMDEKIDGDLTIRELYASEDTLVTTRNVDWIQLINILTVTIVMLTSDKYTLLGRRTQRVDNASGIFAASAAENMHRWMDEPSLPDDPWSPPKSLTGSGSGVTGDYVPSACPNPFFTALRGIREEVAEEAAKAVNVDDIKFLSLAWNLPNFQPHLYAFINVDMKMSELDSILAAGRGADSWEANLLPVKFEPGGQLKNILINGVWADISKGAILRSLVHVYGYDDVNKALS